MGTLATRMFKMHMSLNTMTQPATSRGYGAGYYILNSSFSQMPLFAFYQHASYPLCICVSYFICLICFYVFYLQLSLGYTIPLLFGILLNYFVVRFVESAAFLFYSWFCCFPAIVQP